MKILRLLFLLVLVCLLQTIASATEITIQSIQLPNFRFVGANPNIKLRIFLEKGFVTSNGIPLQPGSPSNGRWYKEINCTLVGSTLTIPEFTIDSTTDGLDIGTATYHARFFNGNTDLGAYIGFESFRVPSVIASSSGCSPSGTCATFSDLRQFNFARVAPIFNDFYIKSEIDAKLAAINGGAPATSSFITRTPDADLTNEFALSTLSVGLLRHLGSGNLGLAVAGTDFENPLTFNAPLSRASNSISLSLLNNSHIAAGAGIVYSKLSLSNSILNADINSAAAIAWTKISKVGASLADLPTRNYSDLQSIPSTFAPSAHATSHRHGGSDEVATATPGANQIVKAGAGGTIADGWLSSNVSLLGQTIDLSSGEAVGVLAAGRFPSLSGDLTNSAGSLNISLASILSAGGCTNCDLTIDAKGRITAFANGSAGGGGGYTTIQEEGSNLTQRATLNFIGGGFTAADDAGNSRTNVSLNALLNAVAGLGSNGLIARTTSSTAAARSLAQPSAGLTISNSDGVSGNPTFALANDLAALEGLASTGFSVRSAADTWAQRSFSAGTGIDITNADGVSGNPSFSVLTDTTVQRIAARKNSTGGDTGTRRRVNFIEGSNVTITLADDATDNELDVTIAATGGGGGGYSTIQEEGSSLTQRATFNFIGASATATDNAGSSRTDITFNGHLNSLAGLSANGGLYRTAANTITPRTITGTTNQVTVTNGDGVSGNPTLSLPQNIHTGASPTFAGGTYTGRLILAPSAPGADGRRLRIDDTLTAGESIAYISSANLGEVIASTDAVGLHIHVQTENAAPAGWALNPLITKNSTVAGNYVIGTEQSLSNNTTQFGSKTVGSGAVIGILASYAHIANGATAAFASTGLGNSTFGFIDANRSWELGILLDGIQTDGTGIFLNDGQSNNGGMAIGLDLSVVSNYSTASVLLGNGTGHAIKANDSGGTARNLLNLDSTDTMNIGGTGVDQVSITGPVTIGGTITPRELNVIGSINSTVASSGGIGAFWESRYSRGSIASPTATLNGDSLFNIAIWGHDGTQYLRSAQINFAQLGTASTGIVPGGIAFFTSDATGTLAERSRFAASGIFNTFKGANVASASTITPSGNVFHVTGTTTITNVSSTNIIAGTQIVIIMDSSAQMTDGGNLVLAGNFTGTANRTITLVWDGTSWFEISRSTN